MNEETNKFQVDVVAERNMVSILPSSETPETIEFINVMKDIPIPDPVPITASNMSSEPKVEAEKTEFGAVGFQIKVEAEEAYKRTETLEKKILELQGGVTDIYNEMKKSWIPNENKNEFEERATTEPTNLIFEMRRNEMSLFPEWY